MAKKHFYEFEAIMKRMEEETKDSGRNVIHIETIQRLLRDTPTVEAVPVVRGEWEKTRLAGEWICNKCQSVVYAGYTRNGYKLFNFCPECGADMRRKTDGRTDKLIDAFCRTGRYETEPLKQYGIDLSESFGNPEQVEIVPEKEWREIEGRCKNDSEN